MFAKSLRTLTALTLTLALCALLVPTADAGPLFGPTDGSWLSSMPFLGSLLAWFDGLFGDELTSLSADSCEEDPVDCNSGEGTGGMDVNG